MNDVILYEIENGIGRIILNYPPSNSMSRIFFSTLKDIVEHKIPRSPVKGIMIYGTGRHYSSGADLADLFDVIENDTVFDKSGNIDKLPGMILSNIDVFNKIHNLNIPVISAIKGVCIGSGLELALFSHMRICSEEAILGFPETTFNLMPGCGGIMRLMELTGVARTLELVLHGNLYPCRDALNYGIVDKILPKKNLFSSVKDLIGIISDGYDRNKTKEYVRLLK